MKRLRPETGWVVFEGSRQGRKRAPLRFWGMIVCASFLLAVPCARGAEHSVQYVDVTEKAGIDFVYVNGSIGEKYMPESMGSGAAFFDYDMDGNLDLYVVNGAALPGFESAEKATNVLYRNRGDGTFADVTAATGVGDTGYGMGTVAGDYDNDGDQDLYVTNVGANVFFANGGDGSFIDVTGRAGVGDEGWGTNASFVDYDNDGDLDLYVANYLAFTVEGHKKCRMGDVRVYCSPTAYGGSRGSCIATRGTAVSPT